MGERYNGIVEVRGSIPLGSTNKINLLNAFFKMQTSAGTHRAHMVVRIPCSGRWRAFIFCCA